MAFANPLALLWGLLAVPIVILYWRRMRLRRAPVTTDMIWQQVFVDQRARSAWQRYRHGVSLAVQLAVLVLVVIAVARPQFGAPRRIVIVLDNSSGTDVAGSEPTWMPETVQLASSLVDELRPCDRAAVLTCGGAVGVQCNLSNDRDVLKSKLQALRGTNKPAQVEDAVELARRMVADRAGGQIVVLSDGSFPQAAELAAADDVDLIRIGRPIDNVAVTRLSVRRNTEEPNKCQALIEVRNFSDKPAQRKLKVDLDGRPVATLPISLKSNGRWQQVFEMTAATAGKLTVQADGDDFAVDNRASVDVPPAPVRRVVLAGDGDSSLENVFRANSMVELMVVRRVLIAKMVMRSPKSDSTVEPTVIEEPPGGWVRAIPGPPHKTLLLDGKTQHTDSRGGEFELQVVGDPPSASERHTEVPQGAILVLDGIDMKTIPSGPVMVISPGGASDLWQLGDPLENPVVARQAVGNPVLEHVQLVGTALPAARPLKLSDKAAAAAQPLARTSDGTPLAWAIDRPAGRVFMLCGDLSSSALPLRTAFPILMTNALDWLAGEDSGGKDDGASRQPAVRSADFRTPGDPGREAKSVVARPAGVPPWLFPVVLAALILVFEWCLYQRRWIS